MKISNVKVYDLEESIIASGYAMGLNLEDFDGRVENISFWMKQNDFFLDFVRHYNSQNKNIGKNTLSSCIKCGKPAKQRVNVGTGGGNYYCPKHIHELYRYGNIVEDEVYEFVDKETVKVTIKGEKQKTTSFLISPIDVPLIFKKNKALSSTGYIASDNQSIHTIIAKSIGISGCQIDHINRDRLDNRRFNLRACTRQQNLRNKPCKGVCFDKQTNKWKAYISVDGKQIKLKRFDAEEDAIKYRLELEQEFFKEYAPNLHLFQQYGLEDINKSSFIGDKYSLQDAVKDWNRIVKLCLASTGEVRCHAHFRVGARVSFDIEYPNYISSEMQRYHWFDIVTSSSRMHRLVQMDFDKCCNKWVTERSKQQMKELIAEYNANQCEDNFMKVLSNCPQGIMMFMRVSTNYEQLRTIYLQRRNHRLPEWRMFCKWIESLPYAEELIICKQTE